MIKEKSSNNQINNNKNESWQKGKKKIIFGFVIILCMLGVIGFTASKLGGDNIKVQAGENNQEENIPTEPEKPKLDNSGYLTLEEDPNADDATMVSENLQGLLKGQKQFPVRTDGKKVVYLTFDDGPSTKVTPEILDTLDKYSVKGTFFVLGNSFDNNEEAQKVLKRIAKDGHAIANHSYSHDYKKLYPSRTVNINNFMEDIEKCNEAFRKVLGKDFHTEVLRFPGGYWSWNGREAIKAELDSKEYHIMEWNALTKDAEGAPKTADQMVKIVKDRMTELGPNADHIVLLMHDINSKEETVKALPQIIEYYKSLGFEFRTMK
ncbi:MAG: polysaccharide deacetylase family protein [Clostridium sp.]